MSRHVADHETAPRGANEKGRSSAAAAYESSWSLGRAWYELVRITTLLYFGLRGGVRITGRENLPREGGALIISNHLSFLDVFAVGFGVPRRLNYVARASLFKGALAPLIRSGGGFPIDRDGGGVAGLRETLRRLRGGGMVLIFPEGTRSTSGEMGPVKLGIAALVRAGVPFVPAAVAGTFEAWPRGQLLPGRHPIWVHFGKPLPAEDLRKLGPEELSRVLEDRLRECQRNAREGLARLLPLPEI